MNSQQEKEEVLETLNTEAGRLAFINRFEKRLEDYRRLVAKGGDFLVEREADDIKATADRVRQKAPDVAKFLDQAREKIMEILRREGRSRKGTEN